MTFKRSIIAFAAFVLAGFPVFAAIPPAEDLLPAETLAMVTVPDWSALHATTEQSPEWLLWNDPAMKPFRDDFTMKWRQKFIQPLENNLGIHVDDYLPLLQGQLTLAITRNGWDHTSDAMPAFLLLLDAKTKSDLLATNLAALKRQWIASGKPVQSQVLEGIKFTVVTLSSNASASISTTIPPGSELSKNLYVGQYKSLLIAGTSVKAVESVAAHLTGGADPALSQNEQFAADQLSQFHGSPQYYGWIDTSVIFDVLSQAQPADDSDSMAGMAGKALLASGLTELRSVSFTYRDSHEGSEVEVFLNAPASSRQGIFKIITAQPENAAPPPFVPADAVKFWRWRVDGQKSWAELQRTLTAISPQGLAGVDAIMGMADASGQQQDPNFSIRKDLIDNLGDDWIRYAKAPSSGSLAELNSAPWLLLFAANNPDQALMGVKTIVGMMARGGEPQSRDFLGRKIYTINLPSGGMNATTGTPNSIYCAASGGYVAVTTDVSMIEGYLRSDDGKTKPLSATPGLAQAAAHVGGMGNGLFGYQNQRETARALFAALKNDPAGGAAMFNPVAMLPSAAKATGLRDLMNFALLPDYDQVSKYFSFTVYGGSSTSEGLDLKVFTPRPPELN